MSGTKVTFAARLVAALVLALAIQGCDPDEHGSRHGSSETLDEESLRDGDRRKMEEFDPRDDGKCHGTVTAKVVALDQPYTYNRFGAFNPVGEIYALERDVESVHGGRSLRPGKVRLRKDKRPRPLVLRVNKGQCLEIVFTNLLAPNREDIRPPPDVPFHAEPVTVDENDAPATRFASLHVNGLVYLDIDSDGANVGRNRSSLAAPGETRIYRFKADREGTWLMHDLGAAVGGEGLGGHLTLGLFGAVNVEPIGAEWFRSQVTAEELEAATKGRNPDGTPIIDYDAVDRHGVPILRILDRNNEIVHGDIDAIITGYRKTEVGTPSSIDQGHFREFTSIFHDEIKAVQAFPELENDPSLRSVRDAFAINYGSAALGPILLANRRRIGPSADCVECKFEEFFLTSWANGDPAMNIERDCDGKAVRALFPQDPGNVHHSYLGDPQRIRNMHAGPLETHIFHLHAHQWLHSPASDKSNYLDSEIISPGSAFTYDINYGGGGNRNFTVGDAIYHCHLYPHFAEGMWYLIRNHDVFEAGTRDRWLPDGEIEQGVPQPAVVPIPDRGMPPMPTYRKTEVRLANGKKVERPALPGYPFFIAANEGHRPSQPPLDLVFDGGLPRHLVTSVPKARLGRRGEFDVELIKANLKLLPNEGTPKELNAQDFHAGKLEGAFDAETIYGFPAAAYPAFTPLGKRSLFFVNGQKPKPGAPYADPCPKGSKERNYRVAYVQLDMLINREGWHDPQARIQVLEEDVRDTLRGDRPPEPLVMRVNSGECAVIEATNLLPDVLEADDFQIFTPTDTIGQHVHLVKFDVTSSDGAANGWNYEDGTFAPEEVRARIEAANELGGAFKADGSTKPGGRRVELRAERHPRIRFAPLGAQTTTQRWWADPLVDRQGRDRTIEAAFTHDHFAPSSMQHHGFFGSIVSEPEDSLWRNPRTGEILGTRDDGGPTAEFADIIAGPNGRDSFRELGVSIHDFVLAYDCFGDPVNPPFAEEAPLPIAILPPRRGTPEAISSADPGTMAVNYRNEPIPLRIAERKSRDHWVQKRGKEGDMAFVFSSEVHGDPFTPMPEAYPGDTVRIRLMEGAQEEMHSFSVNGVRWLHEASDPDSGYYNTQAFGISQHFEFEFSIPPIDRKFDTADLLYGSVADTDLWNGTWGLLRTYRRRQAHLLPLPNNRDFEHRAHVPVCPEGAPKRFFEVHAITARGNLPDDRLVYNREFDLYDPDAILFVKKEHLDDLRCGKRKPEPLVLRAAAGECIQVKLVNDLPNKLPQTPHWSFNPPIVRKFNVNQVRPSNHISLHPQLVDYEVNVSDGVNAGLNKVQTIGPGETKLYTWYAGERQFGQVRLPNLIFTGFRPGGEIDGGVMEVEPRPIEYGIVNLRDFGDVVNHPMHGAIGSLIIEPKGAKWRADPELEAQAEVEYRSPFDGKRKSFKEYVMLSQNDVPLHSDKRRFQCADPRLDCGTAIRNIGEVDDAEDTGHKGFNYRSEPIWARFGLRPEEAVQLNDLQIEDALSSRRFGDPATPIFTAKAGDEVRFRVGMPGGHARNSAITVHNTEFPHEPHPEGSNSEVIGFSRDSIILTTQGGFSPFRHFNLLPINGAGGSRKVPGDYLYRDQTSLGLTGGMWGIWRVMPEY